ncbi:glycosyltransferase [Pseudoalteromonas sp. Angola-7]|uniref:glycosyltransferase family 2 protein n=1 Tax=Pseudoalteromonas sp. Angola-7 TaxID=3025336 RepID=UPI002359424C|nr:glycosyltransferase [Pseudoalteromonas sp. Angola-7]MDC9529638.1 glycosyltransferase [Pseudoalteromonas sp. Angola-7]
MDRVKQNPRLVAAYSRNLHKSGLLYQLQTLDELKRSYADYIHAHNNYLDEQVSRFDEVGNIDCSLIVCVTDYNTNSLLATLKSIKEQQAAFSNLVIYCSANNIVKINEFLLLHSALSFKVVTSLNTECLPPEVVNSPCFFVFAGDVLHPYLGFVLATELPSSSKLAYVDTDFLNEKSQQKEFPDFKPSWNPDLQLTNGYISSGVWVKSVGDFSALKLPLNEFMLSVFMCTQYITNPNVHVEHISQVLLSRPSNLPTFSNAINQLSTLYSPFASVMESALPSVYLRWHLNTQPLVSIIIPTRNGLALVKGCIESILNKTTYNNYEILLIDNGSDDLDCIEYFNELSLHSKIKVFNYAGEFNYSAINNFAAKKADGDVLALVNNDIEVIEPNWLTNMVSHVMRDDIGCVGAKLLYSDNRIQHAGVVMGYGGGAGHGHKYFPSDHLGYMNRLISTQNYSAVTAACLLIKTKDYWAVGGLNAEKLAIAFNDVDLCLKVRALGKRNLYCAEAALYHHESVSRGHEDTPQKVERFNAELAYLQATWADVIAADPAYNPNLTLKRENFAIKSFR